MPSQVAGNKGFDRIIASEEARDDNPGALNHAPFLGKVCKPHSHANVRAEPYFCRRIFQDQVPREQVGWCWGGSQRYDRGASLCYFAYRDNKQILVAGRVHAEHQRVRAVKVTHPEFRLECEVNAIAVKVVWNFFNGSSANGCVVNAGRGEAGKAVFRLQTKHFAQHEGCHDAAPVQLAYSPRYDISGGRRSSTPCAHIIIFPSKGTDAELALVRFIGGADFIGDKGRKKLCP
ncbi:hypothetical protein DSM19430T_33360 [Desulfovibrio psychrotolerans]|uniref:Uncharacterized protein n=1 Tax=Desulfovibrio psychrotolerans TaxID=415242 RepID=A0A7J0BZP3_9BACT|nr:hypothetical protein DSM19430T_33360 [Desulfovibrio psychrotolerans]